MLRQVLTHSIRASDPNAPSIGIEPPQALSPDGALVWIQPKSLASRWGCSVAQVHRLAKKNSINQEKHSEAVQPE